MNPADVFFEVRARDHIGRAVNALRHPHNLRLLRSGRDYAAEEVDVGSREQTPAIADLETFNATAEDRLVVTFPALFNETNLHGPKLSGGVKFGTNDSKCQVLLGAPGTPGISNVHFTIFVDAQLQLWLRDESRYGTSVEANGQNKDESRKNHCWILARSAGSEPIFEEIAVHAQGLSIALAFPLHDKPNDTYCSKLLKFRTICNAAEQDGANVANVDALAIDSEATTVAPSGLTTPITRNIYFDVGFIGSGAFGEVRKVLQSHTGRAFARKVLHVRSAPETQTTRTGKKRPRSDLDNEDAPQRRKIERLRREFKLMIPHKNVIEVFEYQEDPPGFIMEYCEFGNLADAEDLDESLYMSAFGQVLSGLKLIHQNSIVHRDLKPQNILIRSRSLFTVVIADFGLANTVVDDELLTTFCGTPLYAAPEILAPRGHDTKVDIWSLGVMILEWIHDLPDRPNLESFRSLWANLVIQKLNTMEEGVVKDVLVKMICLEPSERWDAAECLAYGLEDERIFKQRHDGLIVGQRYTGISANDQQHDGETLRAASRIAAEAHNTGLSTTVSMPSDVYTAGAGSQAPPSS